MLGKLIKYEFRATGRVMLPALGVLTVLVLLANLSVRLLDSRLSSFLTVLLVLVLIATFVAVVAAELMPIIIMIVRFHKNLLANEGYLMHTLPASVHSLVWAKLIVSLVWLLATNLVIVLLGGLSVMHLAQMNLAQLLAGFPSLEELRRMLASVGLNMGDFYLVLAELALIIILSGLVSCLHFYAAMSLGHTFTRRKGLMSVLCFVGISFAFSLITNLLGIQEVEYLNTVTVVTVRGGLNVLHGTMGKSFFYLLAQGALLYAATVFGLQKKLNLA